MIEGVNYVKAMTGADIAVELGITRQAVSQVLRRAMLKVYKGLMEQGVTESPLKTVMFMRDWFGIESEEDIKQFITMFPKDIYEEVKQDVANLGY